MSVFKYLPGWNVLNSPEEWQAYKEAFCAAMGVELAQWGDAPTKYPAMAVSLVFAPQQVATALAYIEDVNRFIGAMATRETLTETGPQPVPEVSVRDKFYGTSLGEPFDGKRVPTQADFNRHMAASMVTLLAILLENKLATKEAYARAFTANLSVVDRYNAETREAIAKAIPGADQILDTLKGFG